MKLTLLLTVIATLQISASAYSQNTKLSIDIQNGTLQDVFNEIENQSEFNIFYKVGQVDTDNTISIRVKNAQVKKILDEVLVSEKVTYTVMGKIIVITPKGEKLQALIVKGKVTDIDGQPLPGVNIVEKGTTTGAVSDLEGNYTISVSSSDAILSFSYVGYLTEEIEISGRTSIDLILVEDVKSLEEVVVIGYGTRSKRDVTTAISSISNDAIDKTVSMTAESAMQGRMTGVQIASSGSPMRRPTVRIRGVNTWGVSTPLYIIDGIPITELGSGIEGIEDARTADVRGGMNIMTMIDPNDIESISVLKDASAAAIYGVRAANGVILITTKKGRGDKPTVEFSSRVGIQNITQKADMVNTQQFVEHGQMLIASDPTLSIPTEDIGLYDPASPNYLGNSLTYNMQEDVKVKNAPIQDYSIRISGATQKTDYYLSGNYTNTTGALIGNELERYSGSFKLNSQINKWAKIGVNYRVASMEGSDLADAYSYMDILIMSAQAPPWQPTYDPDGPFGYAKTIPGFEEDGVYNSTKLYGSGTYQNPAGIFATEDQVFESTRGIGNVYLEIEPLKNLKIKGQISMDTYTITRDSFKDLAGTVFDSSWESPANIGGGESVGTYEIRDTYNKNMVKEITVNYSNSFGVHNIDLLFNAMDQKYDASYKGGSSEYMTTTDPSLRKISTENQYTTFENNLYRWALAGLLGRVGYNYKYKYYLDVTVRRDGSARFSPENRWGTFPSVSAAWRITNENFMKSVGWVNDLKLRAGWGQLGNQEVRDLAYLSVVSTNPSYAWGNNTSNPGYGYFNSAAAVFGLANPGLQWEKTSTTNIGFDAIFLRGLSMSFEYYDKLTDGILQEVSLPGSAGVPLQPVDNIASVRNSGIELSLNYSNNIGDFNYSVSGNFTTVKNKVESTYKGIPLPDSGIEEGYSLFYQRGYKVEGIFQSREELDAWLDQYEDVNYQAAKVAPGDFYFQDLRGAPSEEGEFYTEEPDGRIDSYDQVYLGKTIPGFFYGGSIDLSYKSFDLSAQFTGVGDVVKYNTVKAALENYNALGINITKDVHGTWWTPENTNASNPRAIWEDPAANFRGSDYFVESAAYLRLSNLQLGYTFPGSLYKLIENSVKHARIYVGASNLFTITNYSGFDPEDDSYPLPQVLFMGLNVKF